MKIKALLFALLIGSVVYAQDFQGTITYKISYEDLPAEAEAYKSMLPNETKVMIKEKISKSVTNNPMSGGETIILSDNESGKSMTLVDIMGEKYAITSGEEGNDEEVEYEESGEEKEIAGYKCKVASTEVENANITVCYTKDLPAIKNNNVKGLDGFPLEIIMELDQMTMIQTVSEINEGKVEKFKYEAPAGYKVLTAEEAKAKFSGLGM